MQRAFTLIELLIAITIISILTGVAAISYTGIRERGRDAQRQTDLSTIKLALTAYYGARTPGSYPVSATATVLDNSTDPLRTALVTGYIRNIPLDPLNTSPYQYKYQSLSSATDYLLTATLENRNNKKGWAGGSVWVADGYQVQPD